MGAKRANNAVMKEQSKRQDAALLIKRILLGLLTAAGARTLSALSFLRVVACSYSITSNENADSVMSFGRIPIIVSMRMLFFCPASSFALQLHLLGHALFAERA
jgi:hypothetical protein